MLPSDGAERSTKISLMVISNNLPDMLFAGLNPTTILDYGSKGAFVNLNKYVADPSKAVYFSKIPKRDMDLIMTTNHHGGRQYLRNAQLPARNLEPDPLPALL
jgi:hypothetical protein